MKKFLNLLLAVFMFASLVAGGSSETDKSVETSELLIAGREIKASLDPVDPIGGDYLVNLGAGELLFKVDADGKINPSLADSAEQIDAHTWNIKLRPDVTFWSGREVGVDEVIASLERSRELDLKAAPFLNGMTFEKSDDLNIKVITEQNNVDITTNLSYFHLIIHNTEVDYETVKNTDLTGMYKIIEFIPKQRMELSKNETYWGKQPEIEKVIHEEITDDEGRVLAALSGRYHVVMNIPVTAASRIESSEVTTLNVAPVANTGTIYLNLQNPSLDDIKVRHALSWGLDREELVILGAEGYSRPVTTWLGSNPAFSELENAVYDKYDLDKANSLLDAAGWRMGNDGIREKNGEKLSFSLRTWGTEQALGEAIQNQWSKIGIDLKVQYGDYSLIQTATASGEWDMFTGSWSTFGDVVALLKGQYSVEGGGNFGGYRDSTTNDLFDAIDSAPTIEKRNQLIVDLCLHIAEQAPVICTYPRPELTAVNTNLEGFIPHFRQFENVVNADLRITK